jgi:TolA-binding protein
MEPIALEILARVDSSTFGYEATAGRYAAFFLGQSYQGNGNSEKAKQYYNLAVEFSRQKDAMDTGYCLYSLLNLGKIAEADNRKNDAKKYFKEVKKIASRKQAVYKEAKKLLKEL